MIERDRPPGDTSLPAHERLYRALRARVMHGLIPPGQALTLRGLAAEFGVSMTAVRVATRRFVTRARSSSRRRLFQSRGRVASKPSSSGSNS